MLTVLLVCTGNICRSPMAEGFLRDRSRGLLGGPLRVASAGTWARSGDPPTPEAVAAAGERGVDIARFRSARLTAGSAQEADVVVTMTEEHRREVIDEVPEAASKTFTLKELVALLQRLPPATEPLGREALLGRIAAADELRRGLPRRESPDADVADPLGLSVEAYRAVAWEIERLVDQLVGGLGGRPVASAAEG